MKIKNSILIEKINQGITSYNKESKKEHINLITNGEILDEDLKKVKSLDISIEGIPINEKSNFFQELGCVLKNMKLRRLDLSNTDIEPMKVDMTFLSKLNKDIGYIGITGLDLSNAETDIFKQFENLKMLILENNNIEDFRIISELDENVQIDMGNNLLSRVSFNEVINEIKKHHEKMIFNGHPYLNSILIGMRNREICLDSIKMPEYMLNEMILFLNESEIYISATPEKIEEMSKNTEKLKWIHAYVKGTKDISTQFLENHPEIIDVKIEDEENNVQYETNIYTRSDFLQIRKKIDEIKQQIIVPNNLDIDREKKIFAQVYQKLGKKIEYDYYAISEEGEKDDELSITCRNLKGGLLNGKSVCVGYADILKNILEEFEIEAKFIGVDQDETREDYNEKDRNGHAWNSVFLDGEEFYCDLTWDADNIKMDNYPLRYFLCGRDTFFGHEKYKDEYDGKVDRIHFI